MLMTGAGVAGVLYVGFDAYSSVHQLKDDVGQMGTRMDRLDTRMDSLDTRMDGIHTRMDGIHTRMHELRSEMTTGFQAANVQLQESERRVLTAIQTVGGHQNKTDIAIACGITCVLALRYGGRQK